MRSPYWIEGPAQICFSGGRTSAYMLRKILDAHGGALPDDVPVVFTNTGKERPETLDFIAECGERWGVPIVWLEWDGFQGGKKTFAQYRQVARGTASENGEPFAALIDAMQTLPNPARRICTAWLKTKTAAAYMRAHGFEEWDNVMGIRADEAGRVARMRSPKRDNSEGTPYLPLAASAVTKRDVAEFWRGQPFDLRLGNIDGETPHGNCDLCFLKGGNQVLSLIRERPEAAVWWMEQESRIHNQGHARAATFRNDRPSYKEMHAMATHHGELFPFDEPLQDCFCGD